MKYVSTILSSYDVDSITKNAIEENCLLVEDKLKEYQIQFDNENAEMIFTNHIVSLVKRIMSQNFIDDIDVSLMQEVSDEAIALARSLVENVFISNHCIVNQSEVFLVATHIQLYLNNKKEENRNE